MENVSYFLNANQKILFKKAAQWIFQFVDFSFCCRDIEQRFLILTKALVSLLIHRQSVYLYYLTLLKLSHYQFYFDSHCKMWGLIGKSPLRDSTLHYNPEITVHRSTCSFVVYPFGLIVIHLLSKQPQAHEECIDKGKCLVTEWLINCKNHFIYRQCCLWR